MANDPATEDLLKSYPRLSRALGWCGLASIVLGYIGTVLGKLTEVKHYLFDLVGPQKLLSIHFGMAFLVGSLFFVGYLTVGVWIYRMYFLRLERQKRVGYGGVVMVGGVILAAGSVYAALSPAPDIGSILVNESNSLERELLGLRVEGGGLRYNRADPSVEPQAWSTAQSLTAILANRTVALSKTDAEGIRSDLEFINRIRLPGEEGWGYLEPIDWGVTEIAAWVVLAYLSSTQPNTVDAVWGAESEIANQRLRRDLKLLHERQLPNGGWAPISQKNNMSYARTYSTTMALWALIEGKRHPEMGRRVGFEYDDAIRSGIRWLLARYDSQLKSWVPNPERAKQTESFPGLTAQILYVLERAGPDFDFRGDLAYERAHRDFVQSIEGSGQNPSLVLATRPASDNERTHDSDRYLRRSKFMVESSTYLWLPWSLAVCSQVGSRGSVNKVEGSVTKRGCALLLGRVHDLIRFARDDPFAYVMAESLFAVRLQVEAVGQVAGHRLGS